jgi:TIR domain
MGRQVPKIFISYAREDAEIARRIYRDLSALGAQPWLDTKSLLPGQQWSQEIGKAIRESDFFIALLSNTALGKRGYVQKEFREAFSVLEEIPEGDIYVLPVRLDDCRPDHPKIKELHWVDLFPSYPTGFEKILRVVRPPNMTPVGVPVPSIEDEADLARRGWGIIFAEHSDPAIRDALRPLLQLRREQASHHDKRFYREFSGDTAYRGDSYLQFLAQNGVGPGAPIRAEFPLTCSLWVDLKLSRSSSNTT